MKNLIIIFFTTILLTGCTGMKIEDFNNTSPEFIPQEYFNGKLRAYGLVKDRSGKITRTFKGTMIGSWDKDGVGTLDEYFVYNDGEEMKRVWTLRPTADKKFINKIIYDIENYEDYKKAVVDFISGMTDRFALQLFQDVYVPSPWPKGRTHQSD